MDFIRNVSTLSMINMAVSAALSILVPIAVIIVMGVKRKLNWKAMLFGSLMFILFALVLENIMHYFVLGYTGIFDNTIAFTLYGGFAAGIFEESARLLCFSSILRVRSDESINTGISYGLGHGGIEAVIVGGIASVSNLLTSIMLNSGMLRSATSSMSGDQLESLNKGIDSLVNTQSYLFLVTGCERVIALALQVALSLFVFKAVVERKWLYFLYAVLIHAGIDMIAVLYQKSVIKSILLVEGLVLLGTVVVAVIAFKINRRKPQNEIDTAGHEET